MSQQQQQQQPLFGIVPAGLPVITQPTETLSPTSLVYAIPTTTGGPRPFSHVVTFLLPGVVLPPGTAAAIYLVTPPNRAQGQEAPTSRFLGGIGPGKESAIFKLGGGGGGGGETSASASAGNGQVILGISIEDAGSVAQRITDMQAAKSSSSLSSGAPAAADGSLALVPAGQKQQPSTLVLAQRIIKNAFNFLSSFSGQAGQVEVVPLKAFEDWWRKFEGRLRSDPGFLERDD